MAQAPEFSYGLLSCFEDCGVTVYVCFCLDCALANNWAMTRSESCNLCHLCCLVSPYWTRQVIRTRRHMRRETFGDCLVMVCCLPCMICQDQRELKNGQCGLPPSEFYFNEQRNAPLLPQRPQGGYPQQGAPQGYAAPPPQGYAAPQYAAPQGYAAPPPQGYAAPAYPEQK
ncbi:putative Cys-rich domain containing protein [Trichomonas vaginalis G3]|uniref:Uncharacterized Cys-rich domain containing protein n=1 Tax=Trichomonas vaginalis (strain ATCC PRA-98 / G3) TaxID=412133 RepID=A2EWV6_TRIV3|nr:uncharacterized protein TVAGG3_0813580 [Trichomonas vaginalis G3]EAY02871.1 putative Cys-rich domain containing protein [Trichomonas vaginalis G3]KAI5497385.1 DUF614 family protein-related family [Trichomonas vaginalis G3]|eukprot:XP_001315094.1 hypothetical protein [Trichomonas vaginalis G3]